MRRIARASLMAAFLLLSSATGLARSTSASYHNPVLDNFSFQCTSGKLVNREVAACLSLVNEAGLFYPKYESTGMTIRVTLYLPRGARLVKSVIKMAVPRGVPLMFKRPASDFHYKMVKDSHGVARPVWTFHHSIQGEAAYWKFAVAIPAQAKPCLGALAVPVGVAGAPSQKAHQCFVQA